MSGHVHWIVRVAIKPGQLEAFKALMADMIASTKNEVGALAYEWHLNADETECTIYERYTDSAAVAEHFGNFGTFAPGFGAAVDPQQMTVFGDPDDAARGFLDGLAPQYLKLSAGFSKF